MYTFPAEVGQGDTLPTCFSSHTVTKGPFCGLFGVVIFAFLCFLLLLISQFKMAHKHSAEMLFSVPKCKKAVMCLLKKIRISLISFRHEI